MKKQFFGPTEIESHTTEINSVRHCSIDLDYVFTINVNTTRPIAKK